ncbi:MAG: aminotransferase class V-fold PLP-dependent enzyme [Bacteroidia bacterium]|nr:aminotransferase class V-fold PLP-dependent enzyme [Bacteroidia bacterium]
MLKCQRAEFSLPKTFHYLDNATLGPLPKKTEEAGIKALLQGRNPVNRTRDQFFEPVEQARQSFGKLVHTQSQNIAIIPSVSYGIATAAKNIQVDQGDQVLILENQFPSNYFIWKDTCQRTGALLEVIEKPNATEFTSKSWSERIIDGITEKTKVVAMAQVHWTDGTLFDLLAISKKCKQYGTFLIIDATQSVGALPFDIQTIQPDALVVASYKWLLGAYGLGFAYYSERLQGGSPLEVNWINKERSHEFENLTNYESQYRPGAARYSMGQQSSFVSISMANASLDLINQWQPHAIQNYCRDICKAGFDQLRETGVGIEEDENRSFHITGIHLDNRWNINQLQKKLIANNIKVSQRGEALRVSTNVYNDQEDINALVETILSNKRN